MSDVRVRINDVSPEASKDYRFQLTVPQKAERWSVVPRVGDYIFDLNEFPYEVTRVEWWEPHDVSIQVTRRRNG